MSDDAAWAQCTDCAWTHRGSDTEAETHSDAHVDVTGHKVAVHYLGWRT